MLALANLGPLGATAFATPAPATGPHINEVLYDAPGADGGYEFVELYNATDSLVSLAGLRLEAGDGAGPGRWRLLWQGAPGEVLAPRARLTIGEALVFPLPDRVQVLALENGPDAVRLVAPEGVLDVLGWGDLTYDEYFAGRPAADVPAGYSLGRSPDGADRHDNSLDFLALSPPTPGMPNRPERDALLTSPSLALSRARVRLGETVEAVAQAVNGGIASLDAGELQWGLWVASLPSVPLPAGAETEGFGASADSLVAGGAAVDPIAPGDTILLSLTWAPIEEGAYRLRVKAGVMEDGVLGNDVAEAPLRVGRGPLEITEVQYAPASGEPEWIEVRCRASAGLDLSAFRLRDASGTEARLTPSVPSPVEPESLLLLTSDAAALRVLHPELDGARMHTFQPWPRLNNEAGGEAVADRVRLLDERGVLSDEMSYAGGDIDGHTLERRDLEASAEEAWNWGRSALPGGTPLAANSVYSGAVLAGALELSAERWDRAAQPGGITVSYRLGWSPAEVDLRVLDLRGRRRCQLARGPSGAFAVLDWDGADDSGRPLPSGPYVVALDARALEGEGRLRVFRPLLVDP